MSNLQLFFEAIYQVNLIISANSLVYTNAETSELTAQEVQWLTEHPVIRVAPDLNYGPVEFEENGEMKGIAMDYLKWMEAHYPIHFEIVKYKTWQAQLDAIQNGEVDLLSGAEKTPERMTYLNFTEPYIETPNILLRRKESAPIATEKDLAGKKIGVIRGYAIEEFMKIRYPNVSIQPVQDIREGFYLLSSGKLDGMMTEALQGTYYIHQDKISNLQIEERFQVDFPISLSMAPRRDYYELTAILNKMLDHMPASEKQAIEEKWIGIGMEKGISKKVVWALLAGIVFLTGIIVVIYTWNRTLKGKERQMQALNEALEEAVNQLKKSQKRIVEMEKVEALVKLVATVAHEINTPLGNSIMTASYMNENYKHLLENLDKQGMKLPSGVVSYLDQEEEALAHLQGSLERLTLIVNRFKALSVKHLNSLPREFDLEELILTVASIYQLSCPFELLVKMDVPSRIESSYEAFEEIFSNLFSNAIEHGFEMCQEKKGKIAIQISKQQETLCIDFMDNGKGIPTEIGEKVLEPLFSTNRSGGIGLNIVLNILAYALDGDMQMTSQENEGLTVHLQVNKFSWVADKK